MFPLTSTANIHQNEGYVRLVPIIEAVFVGRAVMAKLQAWTLRKKQTTRSFGSRLSVACNLTSAFDRKRLGNLLGALDQEPQGGIWRPAFKRDDSDRPHLNGHFDRQNF
jgi:hypothetical protein